jgi:hypothetical protein
MDKRVAEAPRPLLSNKTLSLSFPVHFESIFHVIKYSALEHSFYKKLEGLLREAPRYKGISFPRSLFWLIHEDNKYEVDDYQKERSAHLIPE